MDFTRCSYLALSKTTQLSETFSEGVLVELKDVDQFDLMYAVPTDITKRERTKSP
jgi:hypothetical protein